MDQVALIVLLGAVLGGVVQGLSGFAFGLVAVSVWAWVLNPQLAAALGVFGALTGQILAAVSVRRRCDASLLWPLVAGGLCGLPLGVWLLPHLDPLWFKLILGTVLVLWCTSMLQVRHLPAFQRGGRVLDGAVGVAGGALSALGGFTGMMPALWGILRGIERHALRAVVQTFNLAMLSITMIAYLVAGLVTADMLPHFALVAPAVVVSALLGTRLYARIDEAGFRRIVLTLLALSGAAMLAYSGLALLARRGAIAL